MRTLLRGVPLAVLLAGAGPAQGGSPASDPDVAPAFDTWSAVQQAVDLDQSVQLQKVLAPGQWIAIPLARHGRARAAAGNRRGAPPHRRARIADGSR